MNQDRRATGRQYSDWDTVAILSHPRADSINQGFHRRNQMSEATQTATEQPPIPEQSTAPALYPLDQQEIEVEIKAGKFTLGHKLMRPALAQLIERESQSTYETESVSDSEERISADDEVANVRLWDAVASAVKGYRLGKSDSTPLSDWRTVTDEIRAAIPAAHKATAIRAMYQFSCEVEKDEDEGFTLGAENWTVKQTFGDVDDPKYVVRHLLRAPSEAARREFKRKASDVRFTKGARKMRTKVVTHLKAHVELYDLLLTELQGVVFDGQTWETFTAKTKDQMGAMVRAIDPIWKRQVIDALMRSFEAGLSD
jgi:hypothetical protein